MTQFSLARRFCANESGAVSFDLMALTVAILILGVTVVGPVSARIADMGEAIVVVVTQM